MKKSGSYVIGIDFGTLSGRALLVDLQGGEAIEAAAMEYPHGVMTGQLPDGTKIPPNSAIQDPGDYLAVLENIVPRLVEKSDVRPENIVGIGIDFTGCTLVSTDRKGKPLCFYPEYAGNPLAWALHWKHHGGAVYAEHVNNVVKRREPELLSRHGGKISAEMMMVKVLQMVREAPEIYAAADLILEAGDWMTMQLTGKLVRSSAMAGYKAFWRKKEGYPDKGFYRELDPALENIAETKLRGKMRAVGEPVGELLPEMAEKLGLLPGTVVAVSQYDAHAALPGAGISAPGEVLLTLGTSGGFLVDYDRECAVEGITGMTEDGDLPGYYGYASGQCCLGDMFAWFADNLTPEEYQRSAREAGKPIQTYLMEKAQEKKPGESGLLALDWWEGNRSVLVNYQLSGLILGMTLQTKPEDIYRGLLESAAFGTRRILQSYEQAGIPVGEIHAVGGIVRKNPLLMQIYADVLNRPIHICKTDQAAALGAAIFAAAAVGEVRGGYQTVAEAIRHMAGEEGTGYEPIPENTKIYQRLYREYEQLHDYFGRGTNPVMTRLRQISETDQRWKWRLL